MRKYENLRAAELREMFLNDTLEPAAMCMEDYERLLRLEVTAGTPCGDIVSFCSNALSEFDSYKEINVRFPTYEETLQKLRRQNSTTRRMAVKKVTILIAAAIGVLFLTACTVQGVGMLMGYDVFRVRDWLFNEEVLEILVNPPLEDGSVDLPPHTTVIIAPNYTDEPEPFDNFGDEPGGDLDFVMLDFAEFGDIPDEWAARVPTVLVEEFAFVESTFMRFGGNDEFVLMVVSESDSFITLNIRNLPMIYVEREHEIWVEDFTVGEVTFEIFRNIDDYQVVWEDGDWLFQLNAFLPLEEVKGILAGWY
jgi:hypothetical protein